MQPINQALCNFSNDLYSDVIKSQKDKLRNTFMSPLSIYSAMAMVLAGSRGQTRDELLKAMQLPTNLSVDEVNQTIGSMMRDYFKSDGGTEVAIANRMFVDNAFNVNADYKNAMSEHYGASCENVNIRGDGPGVRDLINKWVSEQTRKKIEEVIPKGEPNVDTILLLVNALYFKGKWQYPFDKRSTRGSDFFRLDGSKKTVPMMYTHEPLGYADLPKEDAKVLKIPFLKSKWELLIILPNQPKGLPSLLSSIQKSGGLYKIMKMEYKSTDVNLHLPRFKLKGNAGLAFTDHLRNLGITTVFSQGLADLSGISSDTKLHVSNVWHRAMLEVDEEGATAAATTAMKIQLMCFIHRPDFTVSHPFFMALVYDKEVPVFVGHVCDPDD